MSTFTKQKTYRLSLQKCALIIFQLGNIRRGTINLFLYATVTKIQLTPCNGGLTDARSSLGAPNPNLTQGPKLSGTGPAVTGCQQLQEERLRSTLSYEKDAAHFTVL